MRSEPSGGVSREEVQAKRERFKDRVSRISPSNSYINYVNTILGQKSDQEIEPTVSESIDKAVGYLIFGSCRNRFAHFKTTVSSYNIGTSSYFSVPVEG